MKPLQDINSFSTNTVIQQNDRRVLHCISSVSFEKETEIVISVKDVLLEEISEGGVRTFGGSESNITHSVKERKLDPLMTLMLIPVNAIMPQFTC